MCQEQRTAVASSETKEKLKDNKEQQQTVNKDRTGANESATTQSTSDVVKVSQRNKKAKIKPVVESVEVDSAVEWFKNGRK